MTKQTYRAAMDALKVENTRLKQRIRELEMQPVLLDERPLDDIIKGYKDEGSIVYDPISELSATGNGTNSFKPNNKVSGFASRYQQYRKLMNTAALMTETVVDTSALDMVKSLMRQKPISAAADQGKL